MSNDTTLNNLGFTRGTHRQKVVLFQTAYNLGPWLVVDGIDGPLTTAALNHAAALGNKLSAHFAASEVACRCLGKFADCQRIVIRRELLQSAETFRAHFAPNGLTVESAYRCPQHNHEVGGASDSEHLYGTAMDVSNGTNYQTVAALHIAAGIGYGGTSKTCQHFDRRDVNPAHNNGGTLAAPITWQYNDR